MRTKALITVMALGLVAGGCEMGTNPDSGLAPEEIAELSDALIQDGLSETVDTTTSSGTLASSPALDVITARIEFSWTYGCPLGGEATVEGARARTRDTETRSGTLEVDATRTLLACARPLGGGEVVITLDGEVSFTAHREWQAGQWHGLQTVTLDGDIDWATDDGRSGTCEIEIEATVDPEARARTVTGTFCEHDVSQLGGWTFGTMSHGPGHHSDP